MIKKAYQKPTINVVKLQHQTHILAGSIQTLQGPNTSVDTLHHDFPTPPH